MTKKTYHPTRDKHLADAIQQQLKDAQFRGLATGAKTMCATVIKKLEEVTDDTSKEDMYAAIETVRDFCNTALGLASN